MENATPVLSVRDFNERYGALRRLVKQPTSGSNAELVDLKDELLRDLYADWNSPYWEAKVETVNCDRGFGGVPETSFFFRLRQERDRRANSDDVDLAAARECYRAFNQSMAEWLDFCAIFDRIVEMIAMRKLAVDSGLGQPPGVAPFPFEVQSAPYQSF